VRGAVDGAKPVRLLRERRLKLFQRGKQSVYMPTIWWSSAATTPPELVFERIGDRYSLAEVTLEGSDGHRTVVAHGRPLCWWLSPAC
jgi:hypothetical protein